VKIVFFLLSHRYRNFPRTHTHTYDTSLFRTHTTTCFYI